MIARGVGVVAQAMDTGEYSRSCRGTHTVGACHEVDDGTHIPLRLTLLVAMRPRVQGTARVSVPARCRGAVVTWSAGGLQALGVQLQYHSQGKDRVYHEEAAQDRVCCTVSAC